MKLLRSLAVASAAVAVTLTSACSSSASESDTSADPTVAADTTFPAGSPMERINQAGAIRIGTKFDQPLFGLKNPMTQQPEGFDIDMGKIIAAKLGIPADKIEWVETVSANREPFLQQGRVDIVIATYSITDARKKVVDFAGPYLIGGQELMVAAGNPDNITGLDALAGKNVCSVEGSTSSTNIREMAPAANLVLFDAYSKCADALKNGQVQVVSTDKYILAGFMDLNPGLFELVGPSFTEEPNGVGIPKGQEDLVTFIDETLQESFDDGEWAKAYDNVFGETFGPAPTPPSLDSY